MSISEPSSIGLIKIPNPTTVPSETRAQIINVISEEKCRGGEGKRDVARIKEYINEMRLTADRRHLLPVSNILLDGVDGTR